MKIGIFIIARLGSTRLQQKHLLKVNGCEIMHYLIDRINYEFRKEIENGDVIVSIVTGNSIVNAKFGELFQKCRIYYGDDDNIPKRQLQAAEAYQVDAIVSIDGDDIFCSPAAMRRVYQALRSGESLFKTEGLPLGLNAWGYSTGLLHDSLNKTDYSLLETGWGRIFDSRQIKTHRFNSSDDKRLRFTLDYDDDFRFFRAVIETVGGEVTTIGDEQLISMVLERQFYCLTERITEEYWSNFEKNISKEEKENKRKITGDK